MKFIKKAIAPIIITILIILYFILYLGVGYLVAGELPVIFKIVLIVIPLGFIALAIYMLYERIQEIKGGEEDDLSKY